MSLFHPTEVVTPTPTFAGTVSDRMKRKKRIGEDVCYMLQKSFIRIKENYTQIIITNQKAQFETVN